METERRLDEMQRQLDRIERQTTQKSIASAVWYVVGVMLFAVLIGLIVRQYVA